jgi:prepilin-type N-terminal cleavage/methylation domain-containing protein
MNRIRRNLNRLASESAGMTLVEVIVAIAIMSIVATSAIGLAISSTTSSVSQQRRAIAVTVANAAMETVSGLPADSLFNGRSLANVNADFVTNASISGVSKTYPDFDRSLPLPSVETVPRRAIVTQNGTQFSVTTVIGTCFERLATVAPLTAAGGDCTVLGATLPPVTPTGYTPLTRVIVVVGWTAGQGCAVAGACTYTISTLLDSHLDLEWATN